MLAFTAIEMSGFYFSKKVSEISGFLGCLVAKDVGREVIYGLKLLLF